MADIDDKRKQFIENLNLFLDGNVYCYKEDKIFGTKKNIIKKFIIKKAKELGINIGKPKRLDVIKPYTISDSLHEYFYDIIIKRYMMNRGYDDLIRRTHDVKRMVDDIKHFINDKEPTYSFSCKIDRTFNQIGNLSEAITMLLSIIDTQDNLIVCNIRRLHETYITTTLVIITILATIGICITYDSIECLGIISCTYFITITLLLSVHIFDALSTRFTIMLFIPISIGTISTSIIYYNTCNGIPCWLMTIIESRGG